MVSQSSSINIFVLNKIFSLLYKACTKVCLPLTGGSKRSPSLGESAFPSKACRLRGEVFRSLLSIALSKVMPKYIIELQ